MAASHDVVEPLIEPIVFLAAAVVAVPLAKRLGLGSVIGYIAAGLAVGPFALGLLGEAERVRGVAEFGVVLLLFVIGLELNLSRLWELRRSIFGLGTAQVLVSGALIALYPLLVAGRDVPASIVAGLGLALSSTALAMQLLEERGELEAPHGRAAFAVLLLQDLAIVPLLALVAFLSPPESASEGSPWLGVLAVVGAVGAVVVVGRYLLNPLFRVLARFGTTRDHDRGGAAGRARGGGADGAGRAFHGHGSVPGRGAAGGIRATGTSWRRTSSRSAGCCSACSSSRSA